MVAASTGALLGDAPSRDYSSKLSALCDPAHPQFALRRADFHFLQTFTVAVAEICVAESR
jgi:hypothetical protein